MRRYLVAVCTRTASGESHLRGYVHDDGKNIYTKYKYRDPWVTLLILSYLFYPILTLDKSINYYHYLTLIIIMIIY